MAPEARRSWLLPLPEEDMCREFTTIAAVDGFESFNGGVRVPQVVFDVGLEEELGWVVVGCVALLLEIDQEVGEFLNLPGEAPDQVFLATRLTNPTVGQRPVGQVPGPSFSQRLPDESICAAARQTVEKGVVDRAHRAAKVSLQRPSAAGGELLLSGNEEIRGLQGASLPHRTG